MRKMRMAMTTTSPLSTPFTILTRHRVLHSPILLVTQYFNTYLRQSSLSPLAPFSRQSFSKSRPIQVLRLHSLGSDLSIILILSSISVPSEVESLYNLFVFSEVFYLQIFSCGEILTIILLLKISETQLVEQLSPYYSLASLLRFTHSLSSFSCTHRTI